jgi:uncharacterized protein (TIGR03437 family)
MSRALILLAALALGLPLRAESSQKSTAPSYSAASIVNSATGTRDALAPNTIATIYGANLSYATAALPPKAAVMPRELAGVRVFVVGMAAALYFVSPQQINFLIPGNLRATDVDLFVAREGTAGPHMTITLHNVGPGLYQSAPGMVASVHVSGSAITKDRPARPGETVMIYGTGWGRTNPDLSESDINMTAAQLAQPGGFHVLVAGKTLVPASVSYAGVTPGRPGLYQVKFQLPLQVIPNPEIRVAIGDQASPPNLRLPLSMITN